MATLVGEEGAGCFVFLWSVTLVFLGLFALPRGVVGRLSSLIVAYGNSYLPIAVVFTTVRYKAVVLVLFVLCKDLWGVFFLICCPCLIVVFNGSYLALWPPL